METGSIPLQTMGPHWPDLVNRLVVQSEIEGGVHLDLVPRGTVLEVETQNHVYILVSEGRAEVRISGHPEFCPEPVTASVHGSTWGGSMLRPRFIGRGMHMEFQLAGGVPIVTSRILEVRETRAAESSSLSENLWVD
jgi:hypothetical protein